LRLEGICAAGGLKLAEKKAAQGNQPPSAAVRPRHTNLTFAAQRWPTAVLASVLRNREHRRCVVHVGGHGDNVIVAELDQRVTAGIGWPDAADQRGV
jgi:hypothetical protein